MPWDVVPTPVPAPEQLRINAHNARCLDEKNAARSQYVTCLTNDLRRLLQMLNSLVEDDEVELHSHIHFLKPAGDGPDAQLRDGLERLSFCL